MCTLPKTSILLSSRIHEFPLVALRSFMTCNCVHYSAISTHLYDSMIQLFQCDPDPPPVPSCVKMSSATLSRCSSWNSGVVKCECHATGSVSNRHHLSLTLIIQWEQVNPYQNLNIDDNYPCVLMAVSSDCHLILSNIFEVNLNAEHLLPEPIPLIHSLSYWFFYRNMQT